MVSEFAENRPTRLIGCQTPRLKLEPHGDDARGHLAVHFARWCGLTLFPWQEYCLRMLCRRTPMEIDGENIDVWAAREALMIVARQNGKGEILVARELAGIFLFGEKQILHTAHLMDTAIDAQKRLWDVIENHEGLMTWFNDEENGGYEGIPEFKTANGKEAIEFPNGAVIRFRTRTTKTGRGLSIDLLIVDECYNLPNEIQAALSKTVRAREQAQTIYISSPVDRDAHAHGAIMSAKRWAAIDGKERTFYAEWSPDEDDDPLQKATWIKCNPSLVTHGYGAQVDDIEMEDKDSAKSELLLRQFRVETLGQGFYYPRDDAAVLEEHCIDLTLWKKQEEPQPVIPRRVGECVFGFDVAKGGASAALVVVTPSADGVHADLTPVMEVTRESFVQKVKYFIDQLDPIAIIADPSGASGSYVHELKDHDIDVVELSGGKVAAAFELLMLSVEESSITHDGNQRWLDQWEKAQIRGEQSKYRSFNRFGPREVTALNALSFALWGLREFGVLPDVEVKHKRGIGEVYGEVVEMPEDFSYLHSNARAMQF